MTRVDFYDGSARYPGDPLAVVAVLAVKAHRDNQSTLVLAADETQARSLDQRLWDMGPALFVPHCLANDAHAPAASVLIATPSDASSPTRPVVINLRVEAVEHDCERILEIIPDDEAGRVAARTRWRAYLARQLKPARIDLPPR